ncbi:unnamed protein product [Adineta steineri]|uniref:NHL repeat containing protein-like protein n=2 Tax=Adineta steineri TaxID=433720 RepID=A0A818G7X1_9BILA|nr:unnamed protein product [Adineta steineri]
MIIPISGCLFHFGQCIWHEVQPCGLQKKYNEDKFFLLSVKTLTAIAFLPIDDIVNTFELLEKEFHDDTNDLLQYFEKTWIGKRKKRESTTSSATTTTTTRTTKTTANPSLSFNQPKFSATPIWDSNGITFANQSIVGRFLRTSFVSTNNTIYVVNTENSTILIWHEESINPTKIIHGNFTEPYSLFVTSNGDIYIDDGEKNDRVQKWSAETNTFETVMNVSSSCWGLFVDINNTLYCSMHDHHQVVKRSLNDAVMNSNRVAAGTGIYGSDSNQLDRPHGIFVDVNLDLYVADSGNDRIQLFQSGELNGITVAGGRFMRETIALSRPGGIVLDAEKYLFIVDTGNNRIVGSGLNGFRCLVGCYGSNTGSYSQSNELVSPFGLSFDGSGNMFVTDQRNNRIQKFLLIKDSFAVSFNQPMFCSNAGWHENGSTFANRSIVGEHPTAIFVDTNNTIYVANQENSTIVIWDDESDNPTKIIHGNFTEPYSLFVTSNGDIYINDGDYKNGRVQKWSAETNTFETVMNVSSSCWGLFVDINNTLYCSIEHRHQVVKRSLNDPEINSNRIAAGTGDRGSNPNQLNGPRGIFVDVNLDLYVADCENDRVQLFQSGKLNGTPVAGLTSRQPHAYRLRCPSGIILDAEKHLFIVDQKNHSIVGSGSNGFRPLFKSNKMGSESNQLSSPSGFSFDRSGNIFVADTENHRIQKFNYKKKSCANISLPVRNTYSSSLTKKNQMYYRDCQKEIVYYESIQVKVTETGYYTFRSSGNIDSYGSIYINKFNPLNPSENLLRAADDSDSDLQFKFDLHLDVDMIYVLVVTTYPSKETGRFSIDVSGKTKVILECLYTPLNIQLIYSSKLIDNSPTFYRDCQVPQCHYETLQIHVNTTGPEQKSCVIGDQCNFYLKGIGLTLDDILRDDLQPNTGLNNQSFSIRLSAGLTIIMFVAGLINSILSFITFKSKDSQQVGCGMYLLVSSITSFLAISMFIIKFWFVVLTHINVSTSLSVLRGGCASIEPILKLFLYLDGWLNACVAIERAALIFKGRCSSTINNTN